MKSGANPNLFAAEPLDRASEARADPEWVKSKFSDPASVMIALWRGDPLVADGRAAWLSTSAASEFPRGSETVFLGAAGDKAYFAIDASEAVTPDRAPFADIGEYLPLREAAGVLGPDDLSMIGQARWLFDWRRNHRHCPACGAKTIIADGGAKQICPSCNAEHFPRTHPVAIVLAVHEDSCLLGRGPHFPPGFLSALAGFIEAAETPEECAVRELKEEAGVTLIDVRYQFSQPWPFPSSLMMGFIAEAADRTLALDEREIVEAKWLERTEIKSLIDGERRDDVRLPPRFTIARQLIERWAAG